MSPQQVTVDEFGQLQETKRLLSAIADTNPDGTTLRDYEQLYEDQIGAKLPFREFNFRSAVEFLKQLPDALRVIEDGPDNVLILPAQLPSTSHVRALIKGQKVGPGGRHLEEIKLLDDRSSRPRHQIKRNINRRALPPFYPNDEKLKLVGMMQNFDHGILLTNFAVVYQLFHESDFPFKQYGFATVDACLESMPHIIKMTRKNNTNNVELTDRMKKYQTNTDSGSDSGSLNGNENYPVTSSSQFPMERNAVGTNDTCKNDSKNCNSNGKLNIPHSLVPTSVMRRRPNVFKVNLVKRNYGYNEGIVTIPDYMIPTSVIINAAADVKSMTNFNKWKKVIKMKLESLQDCNKWIAVTSNGGNANEDGHKTSSDSLVVSSNGNSSDSISVGSRDGAVKLSRAPSEDIQRLLNPIPVVHRRQTNIKDSQLLPNGIVERFRTILERNNGICAEEFAEVYQLETGSTLKVTNWGYSSAMEMFNYLDDIFRIEQQGSEGDRSYLLFDARERERE